MQFHTLISNELGLHAGSVHNVIQLIQEGATTPFIARYRKEKTNGMDEVQIEMVKQSLHKLNEISKRKTTILETIASLDKLTPALKQAIENCWNSIDLEDLYFPYKPKRRTKATIAREKGLEPLAHWLMTEPNILPYQEAQKYIRADIANTEEALAGARDIIADIINDDPQARNTVRRLFEKHAVITTKVAKSKSEEGAKYSDYFKFSEPIHRCPSHRILAILRASEEGFIKLKIAPNEEQCIRQLNQLYVRKNTPCSQQIRMAVGDAYERLIAPSLENETKHLLKSKADDEAIRVFASNAQQLLLSSPLGSKRILALDPGYRSGCKLVCLNEEGDLVYDSVIYPHEPQMQHKASAQEIMHLVKQYDIEAIAIGNGTAGRETELFVQSLGLPSSVELFMVNENGASVYSASAVAREEFPDKDITVRGAVSIGRRLADPLAELVKIDPKSIGVGQYQHDVDQNKLQQSLETVVERCVNQVGVNINTASKSLLSYVSGLNATVAQNIVEYRSKNGAFQSRQDLKKIPRLGEKTFEQCAAFIRIPHAKNPLDNSAVHPESYDIVAQMAKDLNCQIADLMRDDTTRNRVQPERYVSDKAGLPTIQDILSELKKPGRDPREKLEAFRFAPIQSVEDLHIGMIVPGIVTNITKFSCFVDIGVKRDGMVHISQMADKYITDPNEVVKIQQHVTVKVTDIDLVRKRIGLSMKL